MFKQYSLNNLFVNNQLFVPPKELKLLNQNPEIFTAYPP